MRLWAADGRTSSTSTRLARFGSKTLRADGAQAIKYKSGIRRQDSKPVRQACGHPDQGHASVPRRCQSALPYTAGSSYFFACKHCLNRGKTNFANEAPPGKKKQIQRLTLNEEQSCVVGLFMRGGSWRLAARATVGRKQKQTRLEQ